MRYGLLGDDASSDLDKLAKYTGEVDWAYLRPHHERGALLWIDPALEITEVGRAIAEDNASQVRQWRERGDLVKPSEPHATYWESSGARFLALVVSPFVLIQPLS